MAEAVHCYTHGSSRAAFVCCHIVATLSDNKPRGFIWSRDDASEINAYCELCETHMEANGGEWNDITAPFADVKLLCEGCALDAATLNNVKVSS
jgi:hypothetical protein